MNRPDGLEGPPESAGRDRAEQAPDPASFLSGESGEVSGLRLAVTRTLVDLALGAAGALALAGPRLDRLAARQPALRVLVLGIYRPGSRLARALERLRSERHDVRVVLGAFGAGPEPALAAETALSGLTGGKFENLNRLLASAGPLDGYDRVLVVDDDVDLPPRFLDRFVALCERLDLDLAQPAQSMRSHAAWRVTRRRPFSLARRTALVEIGPVTAFSRRAAQELLPFPELRFGWGLDSHWGAVARERGWTLGVVDALPVRHETQPVAGAYTHAEAIAEARTFLTGRPYVPAHAAQRTLATIRRVPRPARNGPSPGDREQAVESSGPAPVDPGQRPALKSPGSPVVGRAPGPGLSVLVVPKWYPWPDLPVFGIFCREHARALAGRHEVVVLASLATPSPPFALYELTDAVEDEIEGGPAQGPGLRTVRVRYRRPRFRPAAMGCQMLGMLAALWRLRREGFKPDVVHAHVFSAALPALALGRLSGAVVVVTEHYTGFQRGLITGADRLVARLAFRGADLVAPVSEELAGHLRRLEPRARLRVMPNTVDTATFTPGAREPGAGPKRLLTVGALAEKKGHEHLLRALAELRGRREVELDIVGDGELRQTLERSATALGLDGQVRFRGEQAKAEVAELMRAADLFVLPSLHETFGCVLVEAMASGLPAVATRVGGVPEVLDPAAGVLVAPRDPGALATGIEKALDHTFDSHQMARSAAERYGYAAFAGMWTAAYEELLSSRGSTSSATRRRSSASR